jgi:hypothetical protein
MLIVRLTSAFLMSILFCSAQEEVEVPTTDPSLTEGPWEMTSASEIDGIFLITAGGFTSIRVYHRSGVKENWGNFRRVARSQVSKFGDRRGATHLRLFLAKQSLLKQNSLYLNRNGTY